MGSGIVYNCPMRVILTHEKSDFDAVASQLGAKKLYPEATAILPRHLNRNVQQFLNLYWDALPFVRADDWRRRLVDAVVLVDTQTISNIRGLAKSPAVHVIDHHLGHEPKGDWTYEVEAVGATSTLLVEKLQQGGLLITPEEATLLLLGIYEDTGSLSYDTTTARDVRAAAWLLDQEAQLSVARRFLNVALSDAQQALYTELLHQVEWLRIEERPIVIAGAVAPEGFDDEISSVAHRLRETLTPDALFVLVQLSDGVQFVARSSTDDIDVGAIARRFRGGGHNRAAAAMVVGAGLADVRERLLPLLEQSIRPMLRVGALMSYGVQTVAADSTVADVAALMQRLGHEGFPVVDAGGRVVGLITRRAVDRTMSHELGHLPVSRVMRSGSVTVRPSDSLQHVQTLMATEGWGQIPVLAEDDGAGGPGQGTPIGIVTRTDLLNALFEPRPESPETNLRERLAATLTPALWALVQAISDAAADLRMPVYLVGGLVRDLLLDKRPTDLDIVVEGDAIRLVEQLQGRFGGEAHSHDRFGTAKWFLEPDVWQAVGASRSLGAEWRGTGEGLPATLDFVTARKEFYRRPTALPDVEPGSIKLDLHRRDFTINTLAIRLDGAHLGQLLDFYGGRRDLDRGLIRVLHSLSFIDDPTRILRAVRLEQRLGFTIEEGTAALIDAALPMLSRVTGDRIRNEIELALHEADPVRVMERLDGLGVLEAFFSGLCWRPESAIAFARIPVLAADPVWRETYGDGPEVFYYFALWLAPFERPLQEGVARRLRVRKRTLDDLLAVHDLREALGALPAAARPSEIERELRLYPPRVLLTVRMLDLSPQINEWFDRYMTDYRHVRTIVTGDDLRKLGLPPSRLYTDVLDRLLAARLDGEVVDEAGERSLMAALLAEAGA